MSGFSFSGFGNQNKSLFGSTPANPFGVGTSSQPQSSIFGTTEQPQQQGNTSIFGASTQPQQTNSLFGASSSQPQQPTSLFGTSASQPQQSNTLFGASTSQPQQSKSLFGGLGNTQNQNAPVQTNQQFGNTLGLGPNTQQNPAPLQYGKSTNQLQQSTPPLWEVGRGQAVYRTIPAQIATLREKWDPINMSSPLRIYLYQVVNENEAPLYQPSAEDDENKWEEAFNKRPSADRVPALVRGFWALGKRAQRQREFIEACQVRLHEINSSLDAQLELHAHQVASRLSECRRKHLVASQRTLSLAAKIQVLRNRGYVMDNAEELLKTKLRKLEASIFDPALNGREQEIYAKMIGIRERGRELQDRLEKSKPLAQGDDEALDEEVVKAAKSTLETYEKHLQHLQKELKLMEEEFGDWEKERKQSS